MKLKKCTPWKAAIGVIGVMAVGSFGGTMKAKASENPNQWLVVNDGVMGGLSQSKTELTDRQTVFFTGTVSLENNGGFASIQHDAQSFDINQGHGVLVRVRGDGKRYQLRLRTMEGSDGMAYKVDFRTEKDEWQEFRFPWTVFEATFRGRLIVDAPELKSADVRQVGFLIADKQEGSFKLEVESIKSY